MPIVAAVLQCAYPQPEETLVFNVVVEIEQAVTPQPHVVMLAKVMDLMCV